MKRITPYQILVTYLGSIIATGHVLFVAILVRNTGQDSWVSLVLATMLVFVQTKVILALSLNYPGKTIVDYAQEIVGHWVGKALSCFFVIYLLTASIIAAKLVGEIVHITIFTGTPSIFISICQIILSYFSVKQGIEVLVRSVEVLFPSLVLLGIVASVTLAPNRVLENMLPILDHDFSKLLFGSFILSGLFADTILYGFLLKYSNNLKYSKQLSILGIIFMFISFIGPLTGPVAIFGPEVASVHILPTYTELTYAEIGKYFERLNPVGIVLWVGGSYIKLSTFIWATKEALKDLFKRPDLELEILTVVIGIVIIFQFYYLTLEQIKSIWEELLWIVSCFVGVGIPALLWIVMRIRLKRFG